MWGLLGINGGLTGILWIFLVSRLQVGQAAVALYLTPMFGVLEAAFFLREPITLPMVVGGAFTLMATVLVTTMDRGSATSGFGTRATFQFGRIWLDTLPREYTPTQ